MSSNDPKSATAGPGAQAFDETLVARSVAGDPRAREELARACLPRVRRTVYLVGGGGQDADDLVQTALTQVFAKLHTFRGEARFTTWLDRVTVNTVRGRYRRRALVGLFRGLRGPENHAGPRREHPDRRAEGAELRDKLMKHLRAIREKKRTALVLHAAYGYSVSEIAELVGCTVETAKKRLQHGRRELVEALREDPRLARELEEMGR